MSKETIGPRIKRLRKDKNITQQELAESLGYSHKSVITNIEKGHSEMSYEKILLLLRQYSLDANDFFGVQRVDELLEEKKKNDYKKKEQFKRTEAIFGKEKMDLLYHSKVIVFGVGGVGDIALILLLEVVLVKLISLILIKWKSLISIVNS